MAQRHCDSVEGEEVGGRRPNRGKTRTTDDGKKNVGKGRKGPRHEKEREVVANPNSVIGPVEDGIDLAVVEEPSMTAASTVSEISLVTLATEMLAYTTFVEWMVSGPGSYLYVADHQVILGQRFQDRGVKAIFVVETRNENFLKGDHIFSDELGRRASKGELEYGPDLRKNAGNEAARVGLFGALLPMIASEGGHQAVLKEIRHRRGEKDVVQHHVPGHGTFTVEAAEMMQ